MKSKFFKSYDNYKEQHVKENVMSISNTPQIQSFNDSDENLEEIKEDDEEIEGTEDCDSCQEQIGIGTEEEKKVELPAESTVPVIGQVAIATEIEIPVHSSAIEELPQTLPISEPVNINNFNPNQNTEVLPAPVVVDANVPKSFSIVKIMTQNGEKIAMCYTDDVAEYGTPLHSNIDFNAGCELMKTCCSEHGIDEFKSDMDTIVGAIPSFMIPKKNKSIGTSYKPN